MQLKWDKITKEQLRIIGGISLVVLLAVLVLVARNVGNRVEEVKETPAVFPSLHITVPEDPFIQERTHWQDGTLSIENPANEAFSFEDVETRFRGRGNSTWWLTEDKRPLRFRFEEPQSVLGSPYKATDWILLANHFDRSLLRNYAALLLGVMLDGLDFTPIPHHVHLYVNGEYMGVYLLTDERDVIEGRMEITWDEDPAVSEFFLELDARAYEQGGVENDTFVIADGLMYDIRYPGNRSRRTPEHVAYVKDYLEQVGAVLRSGDFEGAKAIIDMDSFMDFYIVQEFMKNNDGHFLSVFMTIRGQGEDRRLYMGPVWDFDIAAGNLYKQDMGEGPEHLFIGIYNTWYRYLLQMPEFFALMSERWLEVSQNEIPQMLHHIEERAERYKEEFLRNFQRHPIEEIEIRNMPLATTMWHLDSFEGHVDYLLNWFLERQQWLDHFFAGFPPTFDLRWYLVEYYTYYHRVNMTLDGAFWQVPAPRFVYQDRIMLMPQEIAAMFGLEMSFNQARNTIHFERNGVALSHEIGTNVFLVDGMEESFNAIISLELRGQIFVCIHVVGELLGYQFQGRGNDITITSPIS